MPDKNDKPKRAPPISYRPPKDREAALRAAIAASGLSTSAFITERIFGRSRRRPAELEMLARLLAETTRIAELLHEIILTGADQQILLIEELNRQLADNRAALLQAMGRLP